MSYAEFHKAVRALENPFVVQVGACDGVSFDPVREVILERKLHGLLIEPLSDLLALCRQNYRNANNYQLLYSNLAVAGRSGPLQLRRVPLAKLRGPNDCAIGLATARHHNLLTPEIAQAHNLPPEEQAWLQSVVETVQVTAFPLNMILTGYGVKQVDVLVVDVEGMEREVIESLDLSQNRPAVMLIEHATLSQTDRAALCRLIQDHAYAVSEMGCDWLAIRRDLLPGSKAPL